MVKKYIRSPLQNIKSSDFLTRAEQDINILSEVFSQKLIATLTPTVVSVVCLIIILSRNWIIGIVVICHFKFTPLYHKSASAIQQSLDIMTGHFSDSYLGGLIIRIFAFQKNNVHLGYMAADKLAENQKSYLKIRIFHNLIVNFWGHTSMLLPLIIGIVFIINQKMDLASVMFITQISSNLLWLSEGMASSISDIQKAKVSCDRVLEILSLPDESYNFIPNESEINQQDLPIVFENVSVSFNGKNVLENVNLKIPLNQFTVIIGESGSGKSTLVKSLLGLVNYSGKIYLYGKEIHSYDLCELRQKISYTPQETMIFNASISKI